MKKWDVESEDDGKDREIKAKNMMTVSMWLGLGLIVIVVTGEYLFYQCYISVF